MLNMLLEEAIKKGARLAEPGEFSKRAFMNNKLDLKDQCILITGVSRSIGIGATLAKRFAEAGANVVIHGYPVYDKAMKYPDASENFIQDFIKDLNTKGFNIFIVPL